MRVQKNEIRIKSKMAPKDSIWMDRIIFWARGYFKKHSLPRWLVFSFDGSAVMITFIFAYFLRYNFEHIPVEPSRVLFQSVIVLVTYCMFEYLFRSFAGLIRHTTVRDIFNVFIANTASLFLLLGLSYLFGRIIGLEKFNIPLSIIIIHYVTICLVIFTARIFIKMIFELLFIQRSSARRNVIIFGAGSMGNIVKNVIMSDGSADYNITAFLDNDKNLQSKNISGIPVFHPKSLTKKFLEKHKIESIIFAIKDIPYSEKREIFNYAVDIGLEVMEVPAVQNWLNGRFDLNQLKKIKVEDLLSRDPIQMNMRFISKGLTGRTVLVTGAAGSIGSEIVRQLTKFEIKKLILIDNAETPMFHLQNELRENFSISSIEMILGDVTDETKMDRIFREYKPEIVYHAAAYKHVPLLEENPHEAIRVNVGSTLKLTRLSQIYGVRKFVMVSSDKAVNPTNLMGASKRICEMILQSRSMKPGNRVQYVITRFGNVLGSNGSVVPIFRRQIEEGGPVKVTHPDITRYFMTIPEACQLVLEAGFMGMGGEIFVFDMGKPVKILDLARKMIQLSGFIPEMDIKIEYTGLRPGEKLFEEVLANKEKTLPTYNPLVKVAEASKLDHIQVIMDINTLFREFHTMSENKLISWVKEIVPEYNTTNKKFQEIPTRSTGTGNVSSDIEVYPD